MRSVELFGGAGGLALGAELAGFRSEMFVEWDKWACDTVRENQSDGYPTVRDWRVTEGDVRAVDWSEIRGPIDLVSGGPPCQPFSMGGKSRAADDSRDMFPAASEVIRQLRPRAILLENVKGLTRATFANYFELVKLRLQFPSIVQLNSETWFEHLQRLQTLASSHRNASLEYTILPTVVNAADYGVPQQRHRVFLAGFRTDVDAGWSFPNPTHSFDALLRDQWVTGDYWDRHEVAALDRPVLHDRLKSRVESIRRQEWDIAELPWQTVRDAFAGLPEPATAGSPVFLNHLLQRGAKAYPGHTGSQVDLPAKTLKAGGHGVPGGENMLLRVDGSVRYFSIRESARLQTFPDGYELHGSWSEAMRQLGNAVPVKLAQLVATSIYEHLDGRDFAFTPPRQNELVAPK